MNMRVLAKSRKKPRPGDIFVLQMPDLHYRFGRVIRTDVTLGGFPNCVLIYIYRCIGATKLPIPCLRRDALLVPPIGTNRLPWTRGYFELVEHQPLQAEDVLPIHCFYSIVWKCYFDADGNKLPHRCEPCGEYGVHSFRTIDDEISKALGISLAPD